MASALGKRTGEGVADLSKRAGDRLRIRRVRRPGKQSDCLLGVEGDSTATIVITEDLPDEARLALLDLDVTTEELRGKVLRWNTEAVAWLPDRDETV